MRSRAAERRAHLACAGIHPAVARRADIIEYYNRVFIPAMKGVLLSLVPNGYRLVVTSRPTGIKRAKYEGGFAIFDLKKLSDAQMRQVIEVRSGMRAEPAAPTPRMTACVTGLTSMPRLGRCNASHASSSICSPSPRSARATT